MRQGHQATEPGKNLPCSQDKLRTVHPITTKLVDSVGNYFYDFLRKISNPFSPIEHSICHFLGMLFLIDVK